MQNSSKLEYRPAANLVIEATRAGRNRDPSGAAETIIGRLVPMGDRVGSSRPAELEERMKKARKRSARADAEREGEAIASRKRRANGGGGGSSFLANLESREGAYNPNSTPESRAAFNLLRTIVQSALGGDVNEETLVDAAKEVLAVVRDPGIVETHKAARLATLLGSLSVDTLSRVFTASKACGDFDMRNDEAPLADSGAGATEPAGVAVVIDEESDVDDERDLDVLPDDDEDDADADDNADPGTIVSSDAASGRGLVTVAQSASATLGAPSAADETAAGLVPLDEIDAFFVQRKLTASFDAIESQRLAAEVLELLGAAVTGDDEGTGGGGGDEEIDGSAHGASAAPRADMRATENGLVALLGVEHFALIKLFLKNAARIYFVTRIRAAQTDTARSAARTALSRATAHNGPSLLARLNATLSASAWAASRTANAGERVQREARELGAKAKAVEAAAHGGEGAESVTATGVAAEMALAPRTVDLTNLTFAAGAHTMTNLKVVLPADAYRVTKKGYEEVHVPALKPRPFADGEREIPITELPAWAQPAFAGMKSLNRVQSRLAPVLLGTDENILLCAPTGAGKTNVAVLSIMREVGKHRGQDGVLDLTAFKIVYIAPMKALVQEVVVNFSQRLGAFGIKVRELSGDSSLTKAEIADTQVIVTTPEKWDVVTRKADERMYTALVRLVIIDEVHLLHDERGAVLEAVVARTLRQGEATKEPVRLVGLSATLPNFEDVATFLRVRPESGLFYFDSSFRPCPLQQQYIGITEKKGLRKLALMNEICYEKVDEQAGKNQMIIFVHTRKDTARTARALKDMFLANDALGKLLREDSASREILSTESENVKDADLKELLPFGFAIHHAGMARADRTLVEELFADGHTQVLISTATLAWGVNLPAHSVIIKGTQIYNPEKGRWCELSPLDVTQMLGRAGRPQFDTFGEGVIITSHDQLQFYLSLMNQQLPIESQLVARLADTLNAEIVLGSVTTLREAAAWLGYTYLYVRMLRSPAMYGAGDARADDKALLQRRVDLAHSAALLLDKHNLIRYDRRGGVFQTTALGRVASHYYVTHATIASFNAFLKPTIGDLDLFRLFSLSSEFKNIIVRPDEKEELRKLLDRVPVPVKESVEEPSAKVNVLLQAYISRLPLDGLALSADMIYVHQSAARLTRAIFEICLRRGWAALSCRALELSKMVAHRQWATASPLRQFSPAQGGLTEETLRKLEKKDLPWSRYYDLSPGDLGEMVRLAKLGKPLHRLVHSIPRLEVSAHVAPITRSLLRIDVTLTPDFVFDAKVHGGSENFWVFVEDADGDVILHAELFSLKARYAEEDHVLTFTLPLTEPMPPHYFLRVLSDRWLHSETVLPISFSSIILPSKFAPHTELLDLAPLPVSALRVPEYQALFTSGGVGDSPTSRLRVFNPVQTQTFSALYEGGANVLVSAPSGSGKTVCAEFALLRLFLHEPNARAVYIAPLASLARERFEDWEVRFGRGLGKAVVELTGELSSDLKLVERAHIVISTPAHWDAISRRWKKRRAVQEVRLYVCDELQMVGAVDSGPTYEIVVLRMRFSAAAMSGGANPREPARIVALASSVANSRDLCEWIGAGPAGSFAFHPAARSVPLEVRVQGFEVANFSARILAMARPAYAACAAAVSVPGRSALIFVPSRKQAQLTAIDLISFAAAEGATDRFVRGRASATAIEAALAAAGVEDAALATCLRVGVGYTYEGQRAGERTLVERLFQSGVLGVAVAPAVAAWGMGSTTWGAHLVVIMGTESYDGRVHSQVDYPLTDILRMTGRACRVVRGADGEALPARCVLLCASNRKEYLKKFLYEPLPVESHLNLALHDHFAAEIVNRVMETKQDALDYLTWTFLYRRLTQNPNYYNLTGTSNRHVSDFLSDLVDSTIGDLSASQCIAVEEDEMTLTPLNLGLIASYYYVGYMTLEVFASSLTAKTKMRGVIEILSNAVEFSSLALRHGEDRTLRNLSAHVPLALPHLASGVPAASQYSLPHVKANLLLQAHFTRRGLSTELAGDFSRVADRSITLLQAMVDVISSEGWLKPALAAMEVSQMLVQGLWVDRDSPLQQVPHVTRDIADALAALEPPVESVFDLAALDGGVRSRVLGLSPAALSDVARFCNRYPSIDVSYDIEGASEGAAVRVASGDSVALSVTLTREAGADGMEEGAGLGAVFAPRFPHAKSEAWWVVVGSAAINTLAAIKRVAFADTVRVQLDFPAPADAGRYEYKLFIVSDSYIGCDQEYGISLDVGEASGLPIE